MGIVVLDTSVLIDLDIVDIGEYAVTVVSAVSVGELAFGVDLGPDPEGRAAKLRSVIERYEILRFGVEEAKLYGAMATLVRAAGRDPRPGARTCRSQRPLQGCDCRC